MSSHIMNKPLLGYLFHLVASGQLMLTQLFLFVLQVDVAYFFLFAAVALSSLHLIVNIPMIQVKPSLMWLEALIMWHQKFFENFMAQNVMFGVPVSSFIFY